MISHAGGTRPAGAPGLQNVREATVHSQSGPLSYRIGLLFLLPTLLFVGVFILFPFVWVFFLSFTNQTLTGTTALRWEFIGLENYRSLFNPNKWMRYGEFGRSMLITLQFVAGSALIGQAGLGLLIAILLHRQPRWIREFVQTAVILAWIIPDVVVAFAWLAFLNREEGTLNAILSALGFDHPNWLIGYPLLSIILFNTWRGTAFSMLLFSSALATIPPSYMETAEVIGASALQKFRDITFPLIKNHVLTDIMLITLWTFNTFTPFLLTGGGPAYKSEVVSIYTYRVAFQFFEFGKGSAIAVIVMVVNLILALVYLRAMRRQEVYT